MAVTKIHAIKTTPHKALRYVLSPDKTDGTLLAAGYNCDPMTAHNAFAMTSLLGREIKGRRTGGADNLAYHLIQSFSKSDQITPEQAHEVGQRLADEMLQGKHEYVVATHIDKGHIHNHIIINSFSFFDFSKLRTEPWKTARKIREISDRLCEERGLHVIRQPKGPGRNRGEWYASASGRSWKDKLREVLDAAIEQAANYEDFVASLARSKVEVKEGMHIAFRMEGQTRFTRGKTIGLGYSREQIVLRIRGEKSIFQRIELVSRRERLGQVKELASMLLIAREEGVIKNKDFDQVISELKAQCQAIKNNLRGLHAKNSQYQEVAKYLLAFNEYLPLKNTHDSLRSARKEAFFSKHDGSLRAFDHAVSRLAELGISTSVDVGKVLELVKKQESQAQELRDKLSAVETRVAGLEKSRETIRRTLEGYERRRGEKMQSEEEKGQPER